MADLTAKGVTYPTSEDNIAPLETHLATLAETADKAGAIGGRDSFVGPDATGSTVNVNVVFDTTLATAPTVVCSVKSGASASSYIATIVDTSTTGFNARVYRLNGSGADSSLVLHWIASNYS